MKKNIQIRSITFLSILAKILDNINEYLINYWIIANIEGIKWEPIPIN